MKAALVSFSPSRPLPAVWLGVFFALLISGNQGARAQVAHHVVFNTVGAQSWIAPANVTNVTVLCWGSGGAGGSVTNLSGTGGVSIAGGGSGGGFIQKNFVPVTPGNTYNFTIPSGASGPAANELVTGTVSNGFPTTFTGDDGTTVIAVGGNGGGSVKNSTAGTAGLHTIQTGGDVQYQGGDGATAVPGTGSGGGGGGPGDSGDGTDGVASALSTGATVDGGTGNPYGGGFGGGGRGGASTQSNGSAGGNPGGGGGGARCSLTGPQYFAGGKGGDGQMILIYITMESEAQTTFFSDSFNRAADLDLDASTNGMGGLLVTNGTLTASNIWFEPEDLAKADDSNALINASQQLQMGGIQGTVNIMLNENFAGILPAGTFSILLDLDAPGTTGDTPLQRYQGIGVGFNFAEGNANGDRVLNRAADLFVGETANGIIRVNDEPTFNRPATGDINATTNIDVDAGGGEFVPGTLRLDLTVTNSNAGATVVYNILFDRGSGFAALATGRTFTWSANNRFYIGMEDRSTTSVTMDNIKISGSISTNPPTTAQLAVSPDVVLSTNATQTVRLNWCAQNLPANATYTITASQPVIFPSGGQSGRANTNATNIQAIVNGTLGNTVFTLNLSNAAPQFVATASTTVFQAPNPSTNTSRPNILLILYDDTGWGDFGCYGSPIQTPNIDALAAGGLRFREFYNGARCSPTRCSILTGNYPQQVADGPTLPLPDLRTNNNITIAELLGSTGPLGTNGYRTYTAGKWHVGTAIPKIPTSRGFDHSFGQGAYGAGGGVTDPVFGMWIETDFNILSADNAGLGTPYDSEIPLRTYAPNQQFHYSDGIGDYCVDYLNNCFLTHTNKQPFFIYMPFNAPHFPVSSPATMANQYTAVADPNTNDSHIIQYENGWDVIRQQVYQRQLAMGVLKPGTALSPKSMTQVPIGNSAGQAIVDWNTLSQAQRDDLARREAIYAGAIELDDRNIGKVVNRLKELGQFDNTLIFVLSDNGANYEGGEFGNSDSPSFTPWDAADLPAMGQPMSAYQARGIPTSKYPALCQGGAWANVSNVPFRLYKHFDHNGGIRTPLVISWPAGMANSVKGTWTDERGHIMDIMATIADVTGAPYPTNFNGHPVLPLQGISLLPTFSGGTLPIRDLGFEHETNRAYFRGNWKFVTKNFAFSDGSSPADQLELYDVAADPTELTNQAVNQPVVLANLVDAWNAWSMNVGLPTNTAYLLPAITPPQISPAPFTNDLFVDSFNRADAVNIDAGTNGMSGSRFVSSGAAANSYYEGYEANGANSICVSNNGLRMCVGGGTSESGLQYNFTGPDITNAGGFSVQLRIDDLNAFTPDTNCYAGLAVGLTQAEAAGGADIASPGSFRGNGINRGVADCFVELDYFGNVKMWSNGVLLASVPTGRNSGTLLASFATTNFAAGSTVTVTVFLDGQVVDLDGTNATRTFMWKNSNANYIGLSARATAPSACYVKLDNLAIRTYPLAYALASEYAMNAGLNSPTNAPNDDPDGTGDSIIMDWLKGSLPGANDSRRLLMVGPTAQGEFRFDHFELTAAAQYGVTYLFRYSTNLVDWTTFTPETTSITPDVPGYQLVESRVPVAIGAGQQQIFIRIFERIDSSSTIPAALLVAPTAPISKIIAPITPSQADD